MDIKSKIYSLCEELIQLRRDFHQYPELGCEEYRTAERISDYLSDCSIEAQRITETGIVGMIQGEKKGPTIMLRADMDALPLNEMTSLPYKSKNPGIMHACGHDGHMAMLLIAAKILSRNKNRIKGNIKLVFQPNEENMFADKLVEQGVLDNPKVDAAFGIHLITSIETGKIGIESGPVMAGMHTFELTIIGQGGHTGVPQGSIDPIIAAANIVQTVQIIQTREIGVLNPTLIVFGQIQGGTMCNVIPDKVEMEGTIRYLYDIDAHCDLNPCENFERIVRHVCRSHRAEYRIEYPFSQSAVVNDLKMTQIVKAEAEKVVLDGSHIIPYVTMIGEDYGEYAKKVPSAFYFIGAGNKEKHTDYPHHHPSFDIDEDALSTGVEMHVRTALSYLNATGGDI
jgi:amidohydrolase